MRFTELPEMLLPILLDDSLFWRAAPSFYSVRQRYTLSLVNVVADQAILRVHCWLQIVGLPSGCLCGQRGYRHHIFNRFWLR